MKFFIVWLLIVQPACKMHHGLQKTFFCTRGPTPFYLPITPKYKSGGKRNV